MGELADHLAALAEQTDAVRVVMLTGGLDGYFIAHADLDDLAKLANGEPIEGDLSSWARALHLLGSMPQPTVAAIDGQAWGGGCETSLACTMRIGSDASPPRPAGDRRRHHPRRRRHPAAAPTGGRGDRRRAVPDRSHRRGRGGPAHRAAQRRAARRRLPRRGHRVVPADQPALGRRSSRPAGGGGGPARLAGRRARAWRPSCSSRSTRPTTPRPATPPCPAAPPTSAAPRRRDGEDQQRPLTAYSWVLGPR